MKKILLLSVYLLMFPLAAHSTVLINEDFEVPAGDLFGQYNANLSPTAQALYNKGWTVGASCGGGYCTGAIVSKIGHKGTLSNVLRFRYEEGPSSPDPAPGGYETKIAKECAFGPAFCFGQQKEIWERYYLRTEPVPASTPSCAPNCPTTSTTHDVATKQHYFKSLGTPNGASFVTDDMWNSKAMAFAQQMAVDCAPNCPNLYGGIEVTDNAWHCVETHIKINDMGVANGELGIYIDGVPSMVSTNRVIQDATHATAIDYVMFYRQSGGYQWRFEDDYVMSTTRVGCDGSTAPTVDPIPEPPASEPPD
jgi:hypothetical protein